MLEPEQAPAYKEPTKVLRFQNTWTSKVLLPQYDTSVV